MAEPIQKDYINRTYSDEEISEAVYRILETYPPGRYVSQDDLFKSVMMDLGYVKVGKSRYPSSRRQMREAIGLLRLQGVDIISRGGVGGGYRLSRTLEEVYEFTARELRSRAVDLLTKYSRMRKGAQIKYGGQIGLWDTALREAPDDIMADDLMERLLDILEDPDA